MKEPIKFPPDGEERDAKLDSWPPDAVRGDLPVIHEAVANLKKRIKLAAKYGLGRATGRRKP